MTKQEQDNAKFWMKLGGTTLCGVVCLYLLITSFASIIIFDICIAAIIFMHYDTIASWGAKQLQKTK